MILYRVELESPGSPVYHMILKKYRYREELESSGTPVQHVIYQTVLGLTVQIVVSVTVEFYLAHPFRLATQNVLIQHHTIHRLLLQYG